MRRSNPFGDPAWAQASQNLAKIIAGNPEGKAQYEAALTDIKSTQQADRFNRENRAFNDSAASALENDNPAAAYAQVMRTGDDGVMSALPGFAQGWGGARMMDGGIDAGQQRALISGANAGDLDADTALTFGEGNQISERDAQESIAEALLVQDSKNTNAVRTTQMDNANARDIAETELAGTLEGLLAGQVQGGERTIGDAYQIQDRPTTDEYTAMQAGNEGLGADETARLGESLDIGEVLANDYQMGNLSIQDLGKYRYGHGWPNDLDGGGSGSGGGDGGPMDVMDVKRNEELYGILEEQALIQLKDMGAPTVEGPDGNVGVDTSLAADLVPTAVKRARDMYISDWEANRAPLPMAAYMQSALKGMNVQAQQAEDNYDWLPNGSPDVAAALTWDGQGQGQDEPPAQTGSAETVIINGEATPMSEVEATAKKHGISVEEVMQRLGAKPGV